MMVLHLSQCLAGATILRCRVKLKVLIFYKQCHSSMSVPKQRTNQKTLEAGQAESAFVYSSKLVWKRFYLTATWQSRHCAVLFFFAWTAPKMIFAQGTPILKFERDLYSLLHKYLFDYEYIFLHSFISFNIDPYFMNISYMSKYYFKRFNFV